MSLIEVILLTKVFTQLVIYPKWDFMPLSQENLHLKQGISGAENDFNSLLNSALEFELSWLNCKKILW